MTSNRDMPDWLKKKIRERDAKKELWLDGPVTFYSLAKQDGHLQLLIWRRDFDGAFGFYGKNLPALQFLAKTIWLVDRTVSYSIMDGNVEIDRMDVE